MNCSCCPSTTRNPLEKNQGFAVSFASIWVQVTPGMSVPEFLEATEGLTQPLDAYFEKVTVPLHHFGDISVVVESTSSVDKPPSAPSSYLFWVADMGISELERESDRAGCKGCSVCLPEVLS